MGATIGLDATPVAGAGLKGWQGTNGCEGMTCSFKAQDPVTLTARFTDVPGTATEVLKVMSERSVVFTYIPHVTPDAPFTCDPKTPPANAQSWMTTCSAKFSKGTEVKLWMQPMMGGAANAPDMRSRTDKWVGDCDKKTSTDCTIFMSGTKTVIVQ